MNLINSPQWIRSVLSLLAPVAARMPRQILSLRYRRTSGRWIDWDNPANIQEYFFRQLYEAGKDPARLKLYADLADKIAVRDFVKQRLGADTDVLTGLYGTWEHAADIDFGRLPVPCVIKTNNGCGTNIIVRHPDDLDPAKIRRQLDGWLRYPYGALSGQPHYSEIKPAILAEEFLDQNPGTDDLPVDYKFFCFDGEPKFILYYEGRRPNSHLTLNGVFDLDWNPMHSAARSPVDSDIARPQTLERMVDVARKLSAGFAAVRVDLYSIGNRVVFGEMTFSPDMVTNFHMDFLQQCLKLLPNHNKS